MATKNTMVDTPLSASIHLLYPLISIDSLAQVNDDVFGDLIALARMNQDEAILARRKGEWMWLDLKQRLSNSGVTIGAVLAKLKDRSADPSVARVISEIEAHHK
jgi:hypothetical protein